MTAISVERLQLGNGPALHERLHDQLLLERAEPRPLAPVHDEEAGPRPQDRGHAFDGPPLVGEVAEGVQAEGGVEEALQALDFHDVVASKLEVRPVPAASVAKLAF